MSNASVFRLTMMMGAVVAFAGLWQPSTCLAQRGPRTYFPGVRGGSNYYRGSFDFNSPTFHYGYGSRQYGGSYYGGGYYQNGLGLSLALPLTRYGSLFSSQPYFSGYNNYRSYTSGYGAYYGNDPPARTFRVVPASDAPMIPAAGEAAAFQRQAERAFRDHRYEEAARLSNHALVEDGDNGKLYLFAAQTLFALGDYQGAAAAIHRAAALLDRSEWGYVVQNYAKFYRGRDYVTQMETLVDFAKQHPEAAYAYFLRGYHYAYLGYEEPARKQLAKAVELEPRDRLAVELLVQAGGKAPETAQLEEAPPPQKPAKVEP
ncbi:MAG: tetratricopeptide repeat protein [Pirellulaceae bacterium]